ncbi:MAG: hypothetical protein F6K21_11820 [Symploca sp. SIO2D2]|nr:hypothetical protein [Symploca sp. SIO2D2]
MSKTKLFRLLWRFNAFVIAIAGMFAVGILAIAILFLIKDATRTRNVTSVVNVDNEDEIDEEWSFGSFREVPGTSIVLLPLETEQNYAFEYSGKAANSVRNILFLDTVSQNQRWLVNQSEQLILKYKPVVPPTQEPSEEQEKAVGIFYQIVENDTNNDGRLNYSDRFSLAISETSGERFKILYEDVDALLGNKVLENGDLFVVFEKDSQTQSATIDLEAGEVRKARVIEKLPVLP